MSAEDRKRFDAMAYLAIEPSIHAEADRQAYRAYCDQQEREYQLEQCLPADGVSIIAPRGMRDY